MVWMFLFIISNGQIMIVDEIVEKISYLLKSQFKSFEPMDGNAGELIFVSHRDNTLFYIPLDVARNIAEYVDMNNQLRDIHESQIQSADKLIACLEKQIKFLELQKELLELDKVDIAVMAGRGPEVNLPSFSSGEK